MHPIKTIIAAAGIAISLGGCSVDVASVQSQTQAFCSFLPTAATVINLVSANPAAASATQIASIICAAVTAQKAQMARKGARVGAGTPTTVQITVNGVKVLVSGHFVR